MKRGVVTGSFDVLHPGYIEMFAEAKQFCDHLIVLLHEDPSIERPQKTKPILTPVERTRTLLSLRFVDEVHGYNFEHELYDLLLHIKPDVRFLGDDYRDVDSFTGSKLNLPIHYLSRDHEWSTTKLKTLIAESLASCQAL